MDKIAKRLTDYVIRKGMIDETDRNIYEYGYIITIEMGLFVLISLFMALCLHMLAEGILFFIIFTPLRSYAGGLHLEKYCSCLIVSLLTFSAILLAVRYIRLPIYFSLTAFFLLEIAVYALYPVENANREVDREENAYFRKKLKKFLLLDVFISVLCAVLKRDSYSFLIAVTFLLVVVTMVLGKVIGKYKN